LCIVSREKYSGLSESRGTAMKIFIHYSGFQKQENMLNIQINCDINLKYEKE